MRPYEFGGIVNMFKHVTGPDTELRAFFGIDAITDGNDHVQVVMFNLAVYLAFAFLLNYPEFPDSCLSREFLLRKHIAYVLIDGAHILVKQRRQLALSQPNRVLIQRNLKLHAAIGGLINSNLVSRIHAFMRFVGANDYLPLRIIDPHLAAHQLGEEGVAEGFEGADLNMVCIYFVIEEN